MVKRKSGDSCDSMSPPPDIYSHHQETSKGSPSHTHSSQPLSKSTSNEISSEEANDSVQNLAKSPSHVCQHDEPKQLLPQEQPSTLALDEDPVPDNHLDPSVNGSPPKFMNQSEGDQVAPELGNSYHQHNGDLQLLSEQLAAALLKLTLKDDLVKQHSEAAQDAVAGWQKAEKEAAWCKQQLEAALLSKSSLEARASHLDEALKECVRQLRLGRDEQERKIDQAVAMRTKDLEVDKAKLQDQLVELQELVEKSRIRSPNLELQHKLDFLEQENVALRQQLQSQFEELEVLSIERDLSTKAAETASKQNLESIKNVAKLEAECRKLKSLHRMSSLSNDHRPPHTALSYAESLTDSQSDGPEQINASETDSRKMNGYESHECTPCSSGAWASALIAELDQFKSEKAVDRSVQINLMDDFLQMERLAALPDTSPQDSTGCDQTSERSEQEMESNLRAQVDLLTHRTSELEENMNRVEVEKGKLEEYINRIEVEKGELEEIIRKVEAEKGELILALNQVQGDVYYSDIQLMETRNKLEQLERDLEEPNEREQYYKALAESREHEAETMSCLIKSLNADLEREQAISEEKSCRCKELEDVLKMKQDEQRLQLESITNDEMKIKECALAEARACLEKSQAELKEAEIKLNALADSREHEAETMSCQLKSLRADLEREQAISEERSSRCKELEDVLKKKEEEQRLHLDSISNDELKMKEYALAEKQMCLEKSQAELKEAEIKIRELGKELQEANEERKSLESQLDGIRTEIDSMSTQIESLKQQVHKEQVLVAELSIKVKELENELQEKTQELDDAQQRAYSNQELKIKQEDLREAAGKLVDCQKTITSLGNQLKSLATLEDFLIDAGSLSAAAPLMARSRHSGEPWSLHSNGTYLLGKGVEPLSVEPLSPTRQDLSPFASPSGTTTSSAFFSSHRDTETSGTGFGRYSPLHRH